MFRLNRSIAPVPTWRKQPHLQGLRPHKPHDGLVMSDLWFVTGLLMALVFSLQLGDVRLGAIAITKHLPLMIALAGVLLMWMGTGLFNQRRESGSHWPVLGAVWPFLLLGLYIVTGSLITRLSGTSQNTFLNNGMYMLFGLLLVRAVFSNPRAERLALAAVRLFAVVTGAMVLQMAVTWDRWLYHELQFVVVPMAVFFALRHVVPSGWDLALVLLYMVGSLLFRKNTGVLVGAVTFAYLWGADWKDRFVRLPSFRWKLIAVCLLVLLAALAAFAAIRLGKPDLLPTGNTAFRQATYAIAWERFTASPIWGSAFMAESTSRFTGFDTGVARNVLPTHSDWLDILANGGVIGALLWLAGIWLTWRTVRRVDAAAASRQTLALIHCLACIFLATLLSCMFNPLLSQPVVALMAWSSWGLCMGLALRYATPRPSTVLTHG